MGLLVDAKPMSNRLNKILPAVLGVLKWRRWRNVFRLLPTVVFGHHGDPSRFASVVVTVRQSIREIAPYVVCNQMNERVLLARIVSIGRSIRARVSLLCKQNLYLLVNPNNYLHMYLSILLQWLLTQQLKNLGGSCSALTINPPAHDEYNQFGVVGEKANHNL